MDHTDCAHRLLFVLVMVGALSAVPGYAQAPLGLFDGHADVGAVQIPGAASYDEEAQEYLLEGSGANIWFDSDAFHYVWKRMSGDFILRARAHFPDEGGDPHRKMGWMIRSSLDASAAHVDATVHGDGMTALQYRPAPGDSTQEVRADVTGADVIQLARDGDTYTMSVASYGDTFTTAEVSEIDLGDEVYVGLFVCAHSDTVRERAAFQNVRIIVPAPDDFVPYQDYLGSNVELLDVETGHRRIVYHSPRSVQAPNWTPDGERLIYNSDGLLYRFDLDTEESEVIDTGFATDNNNDHVLSPDGTMLGISHHAEEHDGASIIYTVPVEGGVPTQVTPEGPSYLHGWSPDGRFLTYTAERGGDYDIYTIPVEGPPEIQLTTAEGLDDGSEYAPDGAHIYFNSVRSGTMEIWRMRPDGSEQEQITDDAYNNWFPHVSPDGRWIVFLSYRPDVDPSDHPWYKHVYLRRMPVEGGPPEVVAYVYGGQGTINVPSWSPDGTRVAFVSNTGAH